MKKILLGMFLILIVCGKATALNNGYAIISGSITQIKNGDSVILSVSQYGYALSEPLFEFKSYKSEIVNHHFQFKIPVGSAPLYAELRFGSNGKIRPLNAYLLENGDNINIHVDQGRCSFRGNSAAKFDAIYKLNKILENDFQKDIGQDLIHPDRLKNIYLKSDLVGIQQLKFLNTKKRLLSNTAFTLIKAQILGRIYGEVSSIYFHHYSSLNDSLGNLALRSIKNYKRTLPLYLMDNELFNGKEILQYSGVYSSSIILKYQLDSCYLLHRPFQLLNCYSYIIENYRGALRDRIVTNLLFCYRESGQDISGPLVNALQSIKNKDFIDILKKIESSQIKGSIAYNFTLKDSSGQVHRLTDYKGKVVLIDFWYTGCGNCIKIAPYLQNLEELYANKQVVF